MWVGLPKTQSSRESHHVFGADGERYTQGEPALEDLSLVTS